MNLRLCLCANLFARLFVTLATGQEGDSERLSPDGRFRFEAFSVEDFDLGKRPAFGIIETATENLVSDPEEELGDAFRPSELIYWAPDSLSYAVSSRVGTRHIDTFFYRWNGKSFERAQWDDGGQLESWADEEMKKDIVAQGLPENSGLGQCLFGDDLVERWLDPSKVILTSAQEYLVGSEESGTTAAGSSRAIVRWNPDKNSYEIERRLPVGAAWPVRIEPSEFEATQESSATDESLASITITRTATGEKQTFEAGNWLTAPIFVHSDNEWPGLELVNKGPEGFEWRRLYRVVDGAYRCVRIAELTHFPEQAPEDASLFEIVPGYHGLVLRDRVLKPGDLDAYESFQTGSPAPGGKWKVVFTYHPQYLLRIEIVAVDGNSEPSVIYDFDDGSFGLGAFSRPLWSPDGSALALYLQDGPRVGSTLLYRQRNRVWSEAEMPGIDYGFLEKAQEEKNAHWGAQFESPLFWKSPNELVLLLDGHFRGENGFDYRGIATLSWDADGKPAGCVTVETSQE